MNKFFARGATISAKAQAAFRRQPNAKPITRFTPLRLVLQGSADPQKERGRYASGALLPGAWKPPRGFQPHRRGLPLHQVRNWRTKSQSRWEAFEVVWEPL